MTAAPDPEELRRLRRAAREALAEFGDLSQGYGDMRASQLKSISPRAGRAARVYNAAMARLREIDPEQRGFTPL